jgi:hypothetical protein
MAAFKRNPDVIEYTPARKRILLRINRRKAFMGWVESLRLLLGELFFNEIHKYLNCAQPQTLLTIDKPCPCG